MSDLLNSRIRLEDYQYTLPEERIAKFPLSERDQAKLLVYRSGNIHHHHFYELAEQISSSTHLVFNDTRVIPARLYFKRSTGALVEIFLVEAEAPKSIAQLMQSRKSVQWKCLVGNKKRWKDGEILRLDSLQNSSNAFLEARLLNREMQLVELSWSDDRPFLKVLEEFGNLPLPPYLKRKLAEEDQENYQTIYSHNEGAVAAPTAGLHFTPRVMDNLQKKSIGRDFLTLHVGGGTFQPIKSSEVLEHPMHLEQLELNKDTLIALLDNSHDLTSVGTTSLRALESLFWYGVKLAQASEETLLPFFIEKLYPYQVETPSNWSFAHSIELILERMEAANQSRIFGETEIFIFPSYIFRSIKALITNFHLPNTTLILLVAAFIGEDWRKVYEAALAQDYRFLSYGDSSLLIPQPSSKN